MHNNAKGVNIATSTTYPDPRRLDELEGEPEKAGVLKGNLWYNFSKAVTVLAVFTSCRSSIRSHRLVSEPSGNWSYPMDGDGSRRKYGKSGGLLKSVVWLNGLKTKQARSSVG